MKLWRREQKNYASTVSTEARHMQRCTAGRRVAQVWVGASLQQQAGCLGAATLTRKNHRSVALGIRHINVVATLIEKLLHTLEVA